MPVMMEGVVVVDLVGVGSVVIPVLTGGDQVVVGRVVGRIVVTPVLTDGVVVLLEVGGHAGVAVADVQFCAFASKAGVQPK